MIGGTFRCFRWENAFLSEVSRWIASKLQAYFVWPTQTFLSCLFISCLLTLENWEISSKTLYVQSLLKSRGVWWPWAYNAWGGDGRAPSLSRGTHMPLFRLHPLLVLSLCVQIIPSGQQLEPIPSVDHRLNLYENKQRRFWWGKRRCFPLSLLS